jgi:hypothetical protein
MEAVISSETSVNFYKTERYNIQEDINLHNWFRIAEKQIGEHVITNINIFREGPG